MDKKIAIGLAALAGVAIYLIVKKKSGFVSGGPSFDIRRPAALTRAEDEAQVDLDKLQDQKRKAFLTQCYGQHMPWLNVPQDAYQRFLKETDVTGHSMTSQTFCNAWYDWPGRVQA